MAAVAILGRKAREQGRDTEDEQDVGRVRPDDVAEGKARHALEDGLHRDQKLRRRGAEGDNGERHDQGGNTKPEGKVHRAFDEAVTGEKQDDQTKGRIQKVDDHE